MFGAVYNVGLFIFEGSSLVTMDIDMLIIHKKISKLSVKYTIQIQINSNDSKEEINLHIYCILLFCSHGSSVSVSAPTPTRGFLFCRPATRS